MTIQELLSHCREEYVCIWLDNGHKETYKRNIFEDFSDIIPKNILDRKVCNFGIKDEFTINIWEY